MAILLCDLTIENKCYDAYFRRETFEEKDWKIGETNQVKHCVCKLPNSLGDSRLTTRRTTKYLFYTQTETEH